MRRAMLALALGLLGACGPAAHDHHDLGGAPMDAGHAHGDAAAPRDAGRDMGLRPDFGIEILDGGIPEVEVLDCEDVETPDHIVAVSFIGSGFAPDDLTVDPGDVLRWESGPGDPHTITSGTTGTPGVGALFDETIRANGRVCIRFSKPEAVYPYYCRPHAGFMFGVVRTR